MRVALPIGIGSTALAGDRRVGAAGVRTDDAELEGGGGPVRDPARQRTTTPSVGELSCAAGRAAFIAVHGAAATQAVAAATELGLLTSLPIVTAAGALAGSVNPSAASAASSVAHTLQRPPVTSSS